MSTRTGAMCIQALTPAWAGGRNGVIYRAAKVSPLAIRLHHHRPQHFFRWQGVNK